ncbi:MAG: hypothetical protein ACI8Q1_003260 [Parvicella sp.]|jgi:hypothetical protein
MSEITAFLKKLEIELSNQHEAELVKAVLRVISQNIDENASKSDFVSKIGDLDSILEWIKAEAEDSSHAKEFTTYGENAVKNVLLSMVPTSLMVADTFIEFAFS